MYKERVLFKIKPRGYVEYRQFNFDSDEDFTWEEIKDCARYTKIRFFKAYGFLPNKRDVEYDLNYQASNWRKVESKIFLENLFDEDSSGIVEFSKDFNNLWS